MSVPKLNRNSQDIAKVSKPNVITLLVMQLRPLQWTKNILVFAALLFSYEMISFVTIGKSTIGFILFCFVSGCVYIVNDIVDQDSDRKHPVKRNRPIASGALHPNVAISFGAVLFVCTICLAYLLAPLFAVLLVTYFMLNIAYSIKLKQIVIIDIMIIASGFVFRAIAGGLVIDVPFTPWFLLCTLLLSLFLAISKRRHEWILFHTNKGIHRKVLESYSPALLDQLNSIVITATIISYSLFTFTSGHTIHLMWTIPIVIYGIFRYLYLIHMEDKGGTPEKVLIEDKHMITTVCLFVISVVIILGIFD